MKFCSHQRFYFCRLRFRKDQIEHSNAATFYKDGNRTFFGQVSRFSGWYHIQSLPMFGVKLMTSSWVLKIQREIDNLRDHNVIPNDPLFAQWSDDSPAEMSRNDFVM